jgi:hypothetical protein
MILLPIHIIAGLIAIVAGYVAVFALKGAKLHRKTGTVFVYSMLVLGATGAMLGNVGGGLLAAYFAGTALLTVRERDRSFHWIDAAATLVAVAIGALTLKRGIDVLNSPRGNLNGVPWGMFFFLGTVALLAALGDIRAMWVGGLKGKHRIARHLWRMCFSLFIAAGSFFLGQAQVFPKPIRIYPLLAIPALLPLVLLIYWLVRVLFTKWYLRRASDSLKPMLVGRSANSKTASHTT